MPGECIGVIEEFISDDGTYVKEGTIYSDIIGRALLDFLNKKASVYPVVRRAKTPKIGSIVLGQVTKVKRQSAFIRISNINGLALSGFFTGVLHISDVRSKYVDSMFNVCKPGDILRAEVVSKKNAVFHLTTEGKNFGVVYAFCPQCGHILEKKGKKMRCLKCGKIEQRKTVLKYRESQLIKGENT